MIARIAIVALLAVAACRPEKPACSPAALALLEADYSAAALRACAGREAEDCPELEAIEATYRAKQEAWIACR